jgi:5-formyltetrahydrofolate cyclo-ligase
VREAKAALRKEMKARLRDRPAAAGAEESRRICDWLRPRLGKGNVAAFYPLPGEVDVRPLLAELATAGRLLLPRVEGVSLTLHRVDDLSTLAPGPLGLLEPSGEHSQVDAAELAVVLVPGLAFTRAGARLGRGKGFYDRLLAGLPEGCGTIGVGFSDQVVPSLPVEAHDRPLGAVVLATP